MKYSLNQQQIDCALRQETVSEREIDFRHRDLMNEKLSWYGKGYTPVKMPIAFFKNIQAKTSEYIGQCVQDALAKDLESVTRYHREIISKEQHMRVIKRVGKLLQPGQLGIDVIALEKQVRKLCKIKDELSCRDVCDIRIFRPYQGSMMDNNPLHRDTWLSVLNHCVNVYIPVAGNTRFSSLSLIPGSHLWNQGEVERTASDALIKGVQYGLPSVSAIHRKFKVIRPALATNEVLLFSSNIIHGGALNLNKDTTRVSIEIRFWNKALFPKTLFTDSKK
jgi:hypothetical protein